MLISLKQLCEELRRKARELVTDSRKVCEGDVFAAMQIGRASCRERV